MGAMLFVPCAVLAIAVGFAEARGRRLGSRSLAFIGVAGFAAILLGWVLLDQPLARFAAEDLRYSIWPDAWYLATSVWPVGTGFGTFSLAYQQVESLASVTPLLVNAAHDDYLQLLIEGGAPAAAIVIAFLAWFGWQVTRLARARAGMTGWFAAGGVLLLLVHSAVDYPLRTEALSAVFAALCAILNMAAHPGNRPAATLPARET
jgi:O-antigen ligase